jgi:hypothetical protein
MTIKLKDTKVNLDNLLLDADNYRVAKNTDEKVTSIPETIDRQKEILSDLKKQKLADLKDSILENGFVTVDRIVIKKVNENQYLVIEGNRRVAALKSIIQDYKKGYISSPNIHELIKQTKAISAVLVEGTLQEVKDYSNALMGIRHVSGAKTWQGWQSAKLVNSMFESEKQLSEIGKMLGITSIDAGRRMRGYKAFKQLENDPQYGDGKESHHYAILLEFLAANKKGRDWLGWDDTDYFFEKTRELKRLYRAIVKDSVGDYEVRNIDDARSFLSKLETFKGQELVLKSENFRNVEVEVEEKSIFETIQLLFEQEKTKGNELVEDDIKRLKVISVLVAEFLGGGND